MDTDLPTQTAQTIDEYLASVPEDKRATLENLRVIIRAAAPMAEECISYRIPCFKYHGPLVFFAAFKNHCGLYVINALILDTFKSELKPYKTSGTTIHFTPYNPLPEEFITKIVKMRIEENLSQRRTRIKKGE
jgi:uncharacterized protein YdhG (YjbR/CyaY superfamily)